MDRAASVNHRFVAACENRSYFRHSGSSPARPGFSVEENWGRRQVIRAREWKNKSDSEPEAYYTQLRDVLSEIFPAISMGRSASGSR